MLRIELLVMCYSVVGAPIHKPREVNDAAFLVLQGDASLLVASLDLVHTLKLSSITCFECAIGLSLEYL